MKDATTVIQPQPNPVIIQLGGSGGGGDSIWHDVVSAGSTIVVAFIVAYLGHRWSQRLQARRERINVLRESYGEFVAAAYAYLTRQEFSVKLLNQMDFSTDAHLDVQERLHNEVYHAYCQLANATFRLVSHCESAEARSDVMKQYVKVNSFKCFRLLPNEQFDESVIDSEMPKLRLELAQWLKARFPE